jgi:hypothetical protein
MGCCDTQLMSGLGQSRRLIDLRGTSALPSTPDVALRRSEPARWANFRLMRRGRQPSALMTSRRFPVWPDGRRKQGLQTLPSLDRTMAATALYVRCSSRAVSSLGMSSITACPHASSSCHQRRSPALA